MVVYCASDLIWASKIKGTGEAIGIACRPVRSLEMLDARLADSDVRGLVADLEAGATAIELIGRAKRGDAGVRVLAFGPHVDTAGLQAARDAGADGVYTRGAFAQRMPDLLLALETGARI